MALNNEYIGYKTKVSSEEISKDGVSSYLSAIGSTNNYYIDNNVAPHMFNVVQEIGLVESIWKMEDLYESKEEMDRSVLMLVHGEQTMNFSRMLKFGEKIDSYALIENIQQKGLNNILKLKVFHTDSNNNPVGDSSWTLFIRASDSEIAKAKELKKDEPPKPKKCPGESGTSYGKVYSSPGSRVFRSRGRTLLQNLQSSRAAGRGSQPLVQSKS